MRYALAKSLEENSSSDTVLLVGDLGAGVFDEFKDKYPNQFLNIGVAEQNMTSIAAGMALVGKKVFTYSIANFNTLKCLEQIRNDIAFHNLNVTIVSVGAGLSYGSLGFTHHLTEDLSIMRAIPNLKVFAPCDIHETYLITEKILRTDQGPCYMRLGPSSKEGVHADRTLRQFSIGMGIPVYLAKKKDVAIICTGGIIETGIEIRKVLEDQGIGVSVYSFHTLKPFDHELVLDILSEYRFVFSLEEHSIIGGLSSAIAECTIGVKGIDMSKIKSFALPSVFCDVAGDWDYLKDLLGLSKSKILKQIQVVINGQ